MADLKISQLNSLAGTSLASGDELAIVDTSASETKKITSVELVRYGYGLISAGTLDGDIIEAGTTSARGTLQLTDSTSSTSTTTAATPNAVKTAYDLGSAALPKSGGTMTGQILGDDSTSASTPGYAFDGDPNTGLLRTGADELALVTGGSARLTADASGNVVIPGNLTVQGTTTTIDSTTLVVKDKNIEMGAVATPTDVTADGGGITLKGTTDKTINWIDATDAWTFSEHVNIATGKEYRIAGTKVLDATSLGSGVTGSSLTSVGTIATGVWQGTTVATGYGGTGQTSYTNGQLLIGKTDGTLAKATLTAGSNVTITNGDGTISIAAASSNPELTVAGDTGSEIINLATETLTLTGGTAITSVAATNAVTFNLDNTAVTPGSYTYASLTVDAQGRLTAASSGTTPAVLSSAQTFTAAQRAAITTLTDATNISVDFALTNNYVVTLGGNRTLDNPTNQVAGQSGSIFIVQDGTGSRTLAYGSNYDFAGGTAPTLSTGANAVDRIDYIVRASGSIHCVFTANYS